MRGKILFVTVLLLILAPLTRAETYRVRAFEGEFLIDDSSARLTEPGDYAALYGISLGAESPADRYFYGERNGLRCLLDESGAALTDCAYADLVYDAENRVVFCRDARGLWGALGERGEVLIECRYARLLSNGEGAYLGVRAEDGELIFVDRSGNATTTGLYTVRAIPEKLSEGRLAVCALWGGAELYGYVNSRGEAVIAPQYAYAGAFQNGCAVVQAADGRYGLLALDGSYKIQPEYLSLFVPEDPSLPLCARETDGEVLLIDRTTLATLETVQIANVEIRELPGGVALSDGTNAYVYGADGRLKFQTDGLPHVSARYDELGGAPDRYVGASGEWPREAFYLLDGAGRVVAGPYQSLRPAVWKNSDGLYIAASFRVIEETWRDEYGSYVYETDDQTSWRFALVDENGALALPMEYLLIEHLGGGLFWTIDSAGVGALYRGQ